MKWDTHINYISKRVSRAVGILAILKHYLPKPILLTIYNSLCISHISYALTVWGNAPVSVIKCINVLHKRGIRYVCNAKYNAHTAPLYKASKILNLNDLFNLQCVKIMYKKMLGTLLSYHASQLRQKNETTWW